MIKTTFPSITQFEQVVQRKDDREPTHKEYVRYVRKLAEHFRLDALLAVCRAHAL
jgi:hypothetical protein